MYKGEVANAVAEDMQRHGGLITTADLEKYEPAVKVPLKTGYRDFQVLSPTAPCGSWTALQTLNILENTNLHSMKHGSVEHMHTFIEGARHAFADRFRYMGDPDFEQVPLKGLLSKGYAKLIAEQIDAEEAQIEKLSSEPPWTYFSSNTIHDPWPFDGRSNPMSPTIESTSNLSDCTTHLGTADKNGNIVSCTQTAVSIFGSRVVTPGLGFVWNNGMVWFNAKPGAANSISPWKRPLVNICLLYTSPSPRD